MEKRLLIWGGVEGRNSIVSIEGAKLVVLFTFFTTDAYVLTDSQCAALIRSFAAEAACLICAISDFEGID